MALISLHALSGVFWAGSTLALTHTSPAHKITPELFRAQGPMEHTLGIGAFCAIVAAGVQGGMRKSPVMAQRIAAVLLSATVVCMVISPYVT